MSSQDGVLLLTNDDVKEILDIPAYIDALDLAFQQMTERRAGNMARQRVFLPLSEPDTHYWFNLHAGAVPGTGTAALRVNSGHVHFEEQFGLKRMEFPGKLVGLVLLFDIATADLLAIIHDFYINPIRVSGTSAVGARYLAPPDSHTMGLYGTGWQARWQLTSLMHVCPFREVKVYSPNAEHRQRFVDEQRRRFPGVNFLAVDEAEEVTRGSDVVVAATNSLEPVLKGEWVRPGAHVISLSGGDLLDRRKEVDDETVLRSDLIAVNSKHQVELEQQPDLWPVLESGGVSWERVFELGELALGNVVRTPSQTTFHFNNTGMGIQFAAVGARMYEAAREQGIGTRLVQTWRGRNL